MEIGISTACLYPTEAEKSLSCLLGMGFHKLEVFLNTFSETEPEFLSSMSRELQKYGAEVLSIHPFTSAFENMLFFSDYPRRTEDSLKFYYRFFEAAQRLGAKYLVLHGQRNYHKSRITEEEYLENYHRLFREGQRFGITVAQENVVDFRSEKADFIRRMSDCLQEECAFVLDIKQAVRAGESPMEMCRAMKGRMVHLHLNDHLPGKDCLLPGQGGFDFPLLFRTLKEQGYTGDGVIEVYRNNFSTLPELKAARDYLCHIVEKV